MELSEERLKIVEEWTHFWEDMNIDERRKKRALKWNYDGKKGT